MKKINVSSFDFHDWYLIDIKQLNNGLELLMESAQIDRSENIYSLGLSNHQTLKGKLHINKIKEIKEDEKGIKNLEKKSDDAEVYEFRQKDNIIYLIIIWKMNSSESEIWNSYEIHAEEIFWRIYLIYLILIGYKNNYDFFVLEYEK